MYLATVTEEFAYGTTAPALGLFGDFQSLHGVFSFFGSMAGTHMVSHLVFGGLRVGLWGYGYGWAVF